MIHSEADDAWDLAKSNPSRSLALVDRVLGELPPDDPSRSVAIAARGRALFELGRNDQAIVDLRSATADTDGHFRDKVTMTLAAAVAAGGGFVEAIDLLNQLIETAALRDDGEDGQDPPTHALALSQLGYVLVHTGDLTGAAEVFGRATELLRDRASSDELARVLLNHGYCALMLDDLDSALVLLEEATELGRSSSQTLVVATGLQNQAYVHLRIGDFSKALAQLELARSWYEQTGDANRNLSTLFDDFAETYRLAGLTTDAVRFARLSLESVAEGGNVEKVADATFRLAVCLLDDGDNLEARRAAEQARALFQQAERRQWATRATLIATEAAGDDLDLAGDEIAHAEQAIEDLTRAGWTTEAIRLRNRVAMAGVVRGDSELAERFLDRELPTGDQSVMGQLEVLLHQIIERTLDGSPIDEPLRAAQVRLRTHQHRLTDPELRAGVGRLAEEFRLADVRQSLSADDPSTTLAAEERWRATSLRLPRTRPSTDPSVAEPTRLLREATRRAAKLDAPEPGLEETVRRLEDELRRASHRTTLRATSPATDEVDDGDLVERLQERLGPLGLVEWVEHRGSLIAVSVTADGVDRWDVPQASAVRSAAQRIRRDLTRLLARPVDEQARRRRWTQIIERSRLVADQLMAGRQWPDRVVLCPPESLQELPWPLLIERRAGSVTLSPSANHWLGSDPVELDAPSLALLRGPNLDQRLDDLGDRLPEGATVRRVERADRRTLSDEIAHADLVHIAAHGRFRADSPMFSSIRLHDGEFALHELAEFERVPSVVTLAACDAGRSQHLGGNEQLGAAPAWLSAGVDTVIAPICAVPDEATATFFQHVYAALPGSTPAEALGRANAELADADPVLAATAAAFLCFGSGGPVIGRRPAGDPGADEPGAT